MENIDLKEKTIKKLKLKKEYIEDLLKNFRGPIEAGKIEEVEITDDLSFNLIDYLVKGGIKSWRDIIKNKKIIEMKYAGYVILMLWVALYAFVKYPSYDTNEKIIQALYDLRKKVFMLRHRGLYASDDINIKLFASYMKKYYYLDVQVIKKILENFEELKLK